MVSLITWAAERSGPPGAEPQCLCGFHGTAEAVPFQNRGVFIDLGSLKAPAPSGSSGQRLEPAVSFMARLKPCPFETPFMQVVLGRGLDCVAFAGGQEEVCFQAVLAHVEVVVAAAQAEELGVVAALDDSSLLDD